MALTQHESELGTARFFSIGKFAYFATVFIIKGHSYYVIPFLTVIIHV